MAGWLKMPLGTEVDLGPGDIVLDGDPAAPMERGTAALAFRLMSVVAKRSPVSATAEFLYAFLISTCGTRQMLFNHPCIDMMER